MTSPSTTPADAGGIAWEYRVETLKNPEVRSAATAQEQVRDQLNRLGAEGWELVSVTTTVKSLINVSGNDLVLFFKRPGKGPTIDRPEDRPGYVVT